MAYSDNDWIEKIEHIIKIEHEREIYFRRMNHNILNNHTFHNKVDQILNTYDSIR